MPQDITIKRLKRSYNEVVRKQENDEKMGIPQVVEHFNKVLDSIQEECDIEEIDNIDPVNPGDHPAYLQETRLKIYDVVAFLELDREDFSEAGTSEAPPIQLVQQQHQNQQAEVSLTFGDIVNSIENSDFTLEEKNNLKELVEDFEGELESSDCDKSKLESLYRQASSVSKDVAAQLIVIAVTHGVTLFA